MPVGVGCNDAIGDEFERASTEENLGVDVAGVPLAAGLDGLDGAIFDTSLMRVVPLAVPSNKGDEGVMDSGSIFSRCWFVMTGLNMSSELGERLRHAGRTEFALRIGVGDTAPLI